MDLGNLLSGLIGAVIGGSMTLIGAAISLKGTLKSTEKSIKAMFKQQKDEWKREEEKLKESVKTAIYFETTSNLESLKETSVKTILSTNAWNSYKNSLNTFSEETQKLLITAYAKIQDYNSLVEYDRAVTPFGSGGKDRAIQKQAEKVIESLTDLLKSFKK